AVSACVPTTRWHRIGVRSPHSCDHTPPTSVRARCPVQAVSVPVQTRSSHSNTANNPGYPDGTLPGLRICYRLVSRSGARGGEPVRGPLAGVPLVHDVPELGQHGG